MQGLLERQLRAALKSEGVASLPPCPQERPCRRPTAEQVMRLFAHVARHAVVRPDGSRETFEPELTPLQTRVLDLLRIPRERHVRP